jgi:hypothetical protein
VLEDYNKLLKMLDEARDKPYHEFQALRQKLMKLAAKLE